MLSDRRIEESIRSPPLSWETTEPIRGLPDRSPCATRLQKTKSVRMGAHPSATLFGMITDLPKGLWTKPLLTGCRWQHHHPPPRGPAAAGRGQEVRGAGDRLDAGCRRPWLVAPRRQVHSPLVSL